jgi:hypothetical protein
MQVKMDVTLMPEALAEEEESEARGEGTTNLEKAEAKT